MAKKKKTTTIKTAATAPVKYTGTVCVKTIKKGRVTSSNTYHNEGTPELFNFLLRCLAGLYLKDAQPRYAVLAKETETSTTYVSNNIIEATEITVDIQSTTDASKNYAEYRFFFPYNAAYKGGFNTLLLYNKTKKPVTSAIISGQPVDTDYSMKVSMEESPEVSDDENLLIIWQLNINN